MKPSPHEKATRVLEVKTHSQGGERGLLRLFIADDSKPSGTRDEYQA